MSMPNQMPKMEPDQSGFQVSEPTGQEVNDTLFETEGDGWIIFASIMLGMVGIFNIIYGLVAHFSAPFYTANANYVVTDLRTWSWILLGFGAAEVVAAACIPSRAQWARWLGIAVAGLTMIVSMVSIQGYPFWSLLFIGLNILVIYGLAVYGRRMEGLSSL